jgi:hypothetical protein
MGQINFNVFNKTGVDDDFCKKIIKNGLDFPILDDISTSDILAGYTAVWQNTINDIFNDVSKNIGFSKYNICYEASDEAIDEYDLIGEVNIENIEGYFYITKYDKLDVIGHIELSSCIKINDQSDLNTTMVFIEAMVEKNELYGILLTDGVGNFLNPAHPIVAKRVREVGIEYFFNKPFKIIVYAWRKTATSAGRFTNMYTLTPLSRPITEPVMKIKSASNAVSIFKPYSKHPLKNVHVDININDRKLCDNYVVVPVQVAQYKGIVYPWYGAVAREIGAKTGFNIGPMLSPNISSEFSECECDMERISYTLDNSGFSSLPFDVCTGSYPVASIEGFATLNVANFDSPYHSNACNMDPVFIKTAMAKQSLEILRS